MKDYGIAIDGEIKYLTRENCGVALFRNKPEYDYLDYWEVRDDDAQEHWWSFNPLVARWIGGLAIHPVDQRELQLAERSHGTFKDQTDWNPPVLIEDEPTEAEAELYTRHLIGHALDDDEHLRKDLAKALREDFDGS